MKGGGPLLSAQKGATGKRRYRTYFPGGGQRLPPPRLQAPGQVLQKEMGLKSETEPCCEGLLTLGQRRWMYLLFSLLAPCCPSTRKTMFDILIPWERGPNALDSYKELCPFPPRLIPSMCTWPKPFRGSPHCIHRGAKGQRLRKIQEPQFSVSTSCLGVQRHCVQGWELTKPSGTQAGSTPSSRSPSQAQLTS